LRTGEHLGWLEWETRAVRLFDHDGEVWLQTVELDDAYLPSLAVYRLEPVGSG